MRVDGSPAKIHIHVSNYVLKDVVMLWSNPIWRDLNALHAHSLLMLGRGKGPYSER